MSKTYTNIWYFIKFPVENPMTEVEAQMLTVSKVNHRNNFAV